MEEQKHRPRDRVSQRLCGSGAPSQSNPISSSRPVPPVQAQSGIFGSVHHLLSRMDCFVLLILLIFILLSLC